ncbi:hypothetical protein [Pseudomonas matsuisoli]|jgi:hypothetical protein|uniref:Uncharacterized protein n=1 Tax=Pseudomonas matsuisoli TaxID=1515666 RepID=A0A917Q216_9PSED|nr:hypothetical protein [Pseudomonas matsuisoli]GGK06491.1 hypothetical protein GCM10009304_35770 [Pseudomonas matsuisoli]
MAGEDEVLETEQDSELDTPETDVPTDGDAGEAAPDEAEVTEEDMEMFEDDPNIPTE